MKPGKKKKYVNLNVSVTAIHMHNYAIKKKTSIISLAVHRFQKRSARTQAAWTRALGYLDMVVRAPQTVFFLFWPFLKKIGNRFWLKKAMFFNSGLQYPACGRILCFRAMRL